MHGTDCYAELHCLSCYSFLRGASHPHELVQRAAQLGYSALALTDECSLAGVVKAFVAARETGLKLIVGSEFRLQEGFTLVALAPCRAAYGELAGLISLARRRSAKGGYRVHLRDAVFYLKRCLLIWPPDTSMAAEDLQGYGRQLARLYRGRLWLGFSHLLDNDAPGRYRRLQALATALELPLVACGGAEMHIAARKPLHDVFCALRHNTSVDRLGRRRSSNAQKHLRPLSRLRRLYPPQLLEETRRIAGRCHFEPGELRYEYPEEVVPPGHDAASYLRELVSQGMEKRWPAGVPQAIGARIEQELALIAELDYEYYFLTVHDLVSFARRRGILCQGRGSAANSVVCYCLYITEVSPDKVSLLFERFISRERDEPPDIDVDFEHERREEVIQYIYRKYGRRRAALAATVITWRTRSAVRDVGKALGLDPVFIDDLATSLSWWESGRDLADRFAEQGMGGHSARARQFHALVREIIGFPRHLSQHVGGFVISRGPLSNLVPVENASMPERTVIQWDKEDIEALGLLKVDVLALGMLTVIRKSLAIVNSYCPGIATLADIPPEDPATYRMLQAADSIGVFQIESRAQMAMLPRLRPACFYDLVIEIAIVRPGPIQGDMVHPYLRRKQGMEPLTYPDDAIRSVLERTLGVPIFQEQVIRLAMVAAGFSGGEADSLRRAISNWGKNSRLLTFRDKLVQGMLERGYDRDFAERLFEQIKGFGGYGFPESHSASFALLAYVSAWLKRHHPAAFYTGLLNSQPMGFYTPSQLLQDALRHGVAVLPVAVNESGVDHRLISGGDGRHAIRLGLRLVSGLSREGARAVVQGRSRGPYRSIGDLRRRTALNKRDLEALVDADALAAPGSHRHRAQWEVMALQRPTSLPLQVAAQAEDAGPAAPDLVSEVLADYRSTGLTLRAHPMSLLRGTPPFDRCSRHIDLRRLGNNRFVRIAGLVTCRQRPGTASGVLFLTLEDETGNSNVVVWPAVQQRCRRALATGHLLLVKGILETRDNVTHIIAGTLVDCSEKLAELRVSSRDFR